MRRAQNVLAVTPIHVGEHRRRRVQRITIHRNPNRALLAQNRRHVRIQHLVVNRVVAAQHHHRHDVRARGRIPARAGRFPGSRRQTPAAPRCRRARPRATAFGSIPIPSPAARQLARNSFDSRLPSPKSIRGESMRGGFLPTRQAAVPRNFGAPCTIGTNDRAALARRAAARCAASAQRSSPPRGPPAVPPHRETVASARKTARCAGWMPRLSRSGPGAGE